MKISFIFSFGFKALSIFTAQINPTHNIKSLFSSLTNLNNEDLIDVLNDQGLRTGEVLPRSEIYRLGKMHRVVHLYWIDQDDNLLVQRRSYDKKLYPGKLSVSVTGHVNAGEFSEQALRREINEELGISADNLNVKFMMSFRHDVKISSSCMIKHLNDIYLCQNHIPFQDIKIDHNEVSEVSLIPFDKFLKMAKSGDSTLIPYYSESASNIEYFLGPKSFIESSINLQSENYICNAVDGCCILGNDQACSLEEAQDL